MKKQVTLYGVLGLLMSASAQADFQYEVGVGYVDVDEADGFNLNGTMYFEPVDTSKGPLSEASFLDKASGVTLDYTDIDSFDTIGLGARFVFDNDIIFEASYADNDLDSAFGVGIGTYLSDTSDIVVSYATADESEVDSLGVDYHALNDLSGDAALSYDLGLAYVDTPGDSGQSISGGLTYYPSAQLGFGGNVSLTSVGDFDTTVFGVNAEYFFAENMAVSLDFSSEEEDDGFESTDADTITLAFLARF